MKGVVFNLLEEVVSKQHGESAWDALLEGAGLEGSYTSLGNYPDEELEQLVLAASEFLATPPPEVLRWFGRTAIPLLEQRFPAFFSQHASTRSFVLTLNSIIHPEVRKLHPGARCPAFRFEDGPDGALLLGYHSPRRLCMLAHGFIEGAAAHFKETADVQHLRCMHSGDPGCTLQTSFS